MQYLINNFSNTEEVHYSTELQSEFTLLLLGAHQWHVHEFGRQDKEKGIDHHPSSGPVEPDSTTDHCEVDTSTFALLPQSGKCRRERQNARFVLSLSTALSIWWKHAHLLSLSSALSTVHQSPSTRNPFIRNEIWPGWFLRQLVRSRSTDPDRNKPEFKAQNHLRKLIQISDFGQIA